MTRAARVVEILRRRGLGYPAVVLTQVLWPGIARRPLRRNGGRFPSIVERVLRPPTPSLPNSPGLLETEDSVPIDGDGRATSEVAGLPIVAPDQFLGRRRYDLEVISSGKSLVVRKGYRGDRRAMAREVAALERLAATRLPGPRLLGGDRSRTTVDKSFVGGPTLRDRLVAQGATIRTADTQHDPALTGLDELGRIKEVWTRGRVILRQIDPGLIAAIARQLDALHGAGITGFSLTFGNIVLGSDGPVFIDFDSAIVHPSTTTLSFAVDRDRDRRLFNDIYGSELLTEATAATALRTVGRSNYAPLDLGQGLVTRGFWSVDSGSGRWEYLNRAVLHELLQGARILDLGSHNGIMPLLMLRDGAKSVTAVERDREMVEISRVLHGVFEWRYMRPFALELRHADMLETLRNAIQVVDVVTSFCSLYYLSHDEMAEAVRHAARLAPRMVLQAKTDTRGEAGDDKAVKSSRTFLADLLARNGFARVSVRAPPGYTRPILIGEQE